MTAGADQAQDLIAELLDEGGMVAYVRAFGGDPETWDDEKWERLREQLWRDCHDGERYAWQPLVPLIRSLYEQQLDWREQAKYARRIKRRPLDNV